MSFEIQSRVLSTIILLGEPSNILVQESMLKLSQNLFSDLDACELFTLIQNQYENRKLFDIPTLLDIAPVHIYKFIVSISDKAWSSNLLINDIDFLTSKYRHALISIELNKLIANFKSESLSDKACDIVANGCFQIAKLGMLEEIHTFTPEDNAECFLDHTNDLTPIIPSGIETIDKLNDGGFKNKSLITIAGRSGMGKTGFAVHLAHNIASNHEHKHVLFYSLEMTASDIYEKQLSTILKKQVSTATKQEQFNAVAKASETRFTIHTKPLASIDYIEASARITSVKTPLSVIVVDYLGIVQNKAKLECHALRQADIALRLSALAMELNCIVIALTQVNRDYATRGKDKAPITSDAADSSGSERSSSYWLGIYRPNVDDDSEPENDFMIKCRKNRFGKIWTAYFSFSEGIFKEVNQYIYTARPMTSKKGIDNYKKTT